MLKSPPRLDDDEITELVDASFKRLATNCTRPIIQLIDENNTGWMDSARQPENPLGSEVIYSHVREWEEFSFDERDAAEHAFSLPLDSREVIVLD